jgi:hypothetical protein
MAGITFVKVLRNKGAYPQYDYDVFLEGVLRGKFEAQGNNKDYVFINKAGNIVFYEGTLKAYRAANSEQLLETFLKIVTDDALPTPEDIARQLAIQEEQREAEALRNLQEDEVEREAYQLLLDIYSAVPLPGELLRKINQLIVKVKE